MTFGKSIDAVSRGILRQTLAQNCPRTVPGTKYGLAGRFSIRRKRELGFGRLQPRVLEKYRVTRTKLRKLQTNSTSPIGTWIPCEIVQTGLKNVISLEHDPVYRLYSWIWNTVPDTRYFAFMPFVVTLIFELAINGLYIALDLLQLERMKRYRIAYAGKDRPYPTPSETWHGIKIMLGGYARVIVPLQSLLALAVWYRKVDLGDDRPETVWWGRILLESVLCVLLADVWNYLIHRLMHLGPLYARFHRLHHDFIYTHVSANHAFHDIELFLYGLSVGIPPLLINAHIFTHWAHTAFTIVHTAAQHSGYDLLFSSASSFHDGHHIFVGKNFSAHLPVMDVIFGTYIRNAEPERKSARNRSYQTRMPEPGAFAWWANALVLPSNLRIGKAGTIERE